VTGPAAQPAGRAAFYRVRLRRAAGQLRHLPAALRLAWDAAPGWTLAWIVLLLVQGLLPAVLVYLTRAVVNALVAVTDAGLTPESAGPVIALALLVGGLLMLSETLRAATNYVRLVEAERLTDHITNLAQARSLAVDLAFYDDPDSYDHLHRARDEAAQRPLALIEGLGSLLQHGVTLLAMMLVLAPYGPWLPVALLISTVPAVLVVLRGTERYHSWYQRTTADQRLAHYLDWLTASRESAAEVRLFGLAGMLQERHRLLRQRLRDERLALARAQGRSELVAGGIGLGVTAAALAGMLWQTLAGPYSLGDLALMTQAFTQGRELVRSLLGHVGQIYRNSLFLGDLFGFLAIRPEVVDPPEPAELPAGPLGVRFRDVTFRYRGGRGPVLEHFDLDVPAGRTVAILGRNGAGKSTMIKLLCRFYDPEAGAVEVGGVDVRRLAQADLRRRITVLFQVPLQYNATLRENIALADGTASPGALQAAARGSGADAVAARLPDGYETLLGVWFPGGTDLSVGEWQRLALARAYLREAPIMVLDEPTSAMDPWAEAAWFEQFRMLSRHCTVILITHRLTTARHADEIHIMEAGRLVESGTHDELLAAGGDYARSWLRQLGERADRDAGATHPGGGME
jgi:ATP-binding cassette subfamily B protein